MIARNPTANPTSNQTHVKAIRHNVPGKIQITLFKEWAHDTGRSNFLNSYVFAVCDTEEEANKMVAWVAAKGFEVLH